MIEFVAIAFIALFAFLVVSRIVGRRSKKQGRSADETSLSRWVRAEVAKLSAEKLELEESDVEQTLTSSPDPDVVTRLEQMISKVEVVYERVPGTSSEADVRVEISYEDGRTARSVKRVPQSDLPESVMTELSETGTSHVYRPFLFPWQV